jgi:hypothetical protein
MIQGVKFIRIDLYWHFYDHLASYDIEDTITAENRHVKYININNGFTQNTLFLTPLPCLNNYLFFR